jgi:Heparan-alpha-glucosaminide N-acetyltransferase, catalytic
MQPTHSLLAPDDTRLHVSSAPAAPRFDALDRLRALAVVLMVQGHTFSALLAVDALPRSVMQVHAIVHGVTAPAFLLGAGLAFGLSTYSRYPLHHRSLSQLGARTQRYGSLLLLGYALQLPGSSLLAALRMRSEDLTPVLRVGPLQLIALCLMLCQLGARVLSSARAHAWCALVLGSLVAACAPLVYSGRAGQGAGPLLGPWLDASSGSLFPIFPWASFAFFGVALAGYLSLRERPLPRAASWLVLGLLLAGGAYLLFWLGLRLSEPAWFWHASPINVLFRVGLVLCLLGLFQFYGEVTRPPRPSRRSRAGTHRAARFAALTKGYHATACEPPAAAAGSGSTRLLARHSLVAFVVHLLLLYGTPFTPSLYKHYGQRLAAGQCALVFVAIMALTMLMIRGWVALQGEPRMATGWLRVLLTALGVFVLMR